MLLSRCHGVEGRVEQHVNGLVKYLAPVLCSNEIAWCIPSLKFLQVYYPGCAEPP
ncbi:hypothetical protein AMATHDRAFT_71990 [Amanita thiersii Skay4041]|uniref:Uncharacterized protein n=1 Tax=Amanita thiersii Skay4041 TaxID=703135 RepID=A0A2A9N6C5_9AGAR|nr:hypothetical protein AMATHDRAFT_71990 [Amanita thiersii Skay4041]